MLRATVLFLILAAGVRAETLDAWDLSEKLGAAGFSPEGVSCETKNGKLLCTAILRPEYDGADESSADRRREARALYERLASGQITEIERERLFVLIVLQTFKLKGDFNPASVHFHTSPKSTGGLGR